MPVGLTAGFDLVFAVSARTFGAILEGTTRTMFTSPVVTPLGTFSFDDQRTDAWVGTTVGNTIELRFSFFNLRAVVGPATISMGPLWSDFFVPGALTTAPAPGAAGSVDLVLNLTGAATQFDADDDAALLAAGLTEAQVAAIFGSNLPPSVPVTTTPIPIIPQAPAAAPGAFPGTANIAVAVQRRANAAAVGEEAIAILFNFQNRPNTPAGRPLGSPALVPASTFGVGQDLLLEIANSFLFELLATLVLEAPAAPGAPGLGVPVASVGITAAGITLLAPAPVTLAGTAGTLTVFTLTPPSPGTTAMTLSVTFTFVLDSITYIVTITGATLTVGLAGLSIVIATAVPPAVVTTIVPWWVVVLRVLEGAALGYLIGGPIGELIGCLVGGLSVVLETSIVSAIVGPSASSGLGTAIGGAGGGLIPPAIAGLLGGATLSPPLVFDDLQVGGCASVADVVQIRRQVPAVELRSGARIDLDQPAFTWGYVMGKRKPKHVGIRGSLSSDDLQWDSVSGLQAIAGARMVRLTGRFASTSFADASGALAGGATEIVAAADVPVLSEQDVAGGRRRRGVVVAVKTGAGRVAKAVAWKDSNAHLVLRYLVWDTSGAAARIFPAEPQWSRTQTVRDPDTPGTSSEPPIFHFRYAHQTTLRIRTNRMTGPLTVRWSMAGATIAGNGSATIAGAAVSWSAAADTVTLNVGLGDSLSGEFLECEVTDNNGVVASDRAQLRVVGREDRQESALEVTAQKIKDRMDEIIGRLHERPPSFGPSGPAGPVGNVTSGLAVQELETVVFTAIEAGGLKLDRQKVRLQ